MTCCNSIAVLRCGREREREGESGLVLGKRSCLIGHNGLLILEKRDMKAGSYIMTHKQMRMVKKLCH